MPITKHHAVAMVAAAKTMKISIIIPVLNEQENLERLLPSLQSMSDAGHEVIVVDGGSTDNSKEIASQYANHVVSSLPGRARQMNTGAAHATGEVLWFLHADSVLRGRDKEIQKVAQWGWCKLRINSPSLLLRIVSLMMNVRSRLTAIATGDQGIYVRRELFEQVGGYADIPLMEDIELSRRLKRVAKPITLSYRLLTSPRRWQQNGIIRTIWSMWGFRLRYWMGESTDALAERYYPSRKITQPVKHEYAVFVFARAAVGGSVKTRLAPVLTESERHAFHNELTNKALETAKSTGLPVELWTTDEHNHDIRRLAGQYNAGIKQQTGNDLGERMLHALLDGLQRYKGIILIGTDCPVMQAEYIGSAVQLLDKGKDVVLGPAEDGGYVLLAARRLLKPMFTDISWGTDRVYEQTRGRLNVAAMQYVSQEVLWDIDRPEDYRRYQELKSSQPVDQAIAASA